MHDERTDPSMYHSTEGLVRSSQALSRTNENENFRFRFFGFETGCELVRVFLKLVFKLVLNLGGGLEIGYNESSNWKFGSKRFEAV